MEREERKPEEKERGITLLKLIKKETKSLKKGCAAKQHEVEFKYFKHQSFSDVTSNSSHRSRVRFA